MTAWKTSHSMHVKMRDVVYTICERQATNRRCNPFQIDNNYRFFPRFFVLLFFLFVTYILFFSIQHASHYYITHCSSSKYLNSRCTNTKRKRKLTHHTPFYFNIGSCYTCSTFLCNCRFRRQHTFIC